MRDNAERVSRIPLSLSVYVRTLDSQELITGKASTNLIGSSLRDCARHPSRTTGRRFPCRAVGPSHR